VRVGVNLLWLRPGHVGGSETYVTRLLRAVADAGSADDIDVRLLALPELAQAHPDLARAFPVVSPPGPVSNRALRVAAESTWLPVQARRLGLDLLHHAGGTAPLASPVPSVVTIHDLQYLTLPGSFSRVKLAFLSNRVPAAVSQARLTLTTSRFVKSTVMDAFGVGDDDVAVVPPVVDAHSGAQPAGMGEVVRSVGVTAPYFVYPAISYPHKNHAVVIRALADVPDVQLVLTGAPWPGDAAVEDAIGAAGVGDRVVRAGYVSGSTLDALYRGALGLVFPSVYEGFGMAALEAMTRGCPVIAADATALPETVDGAGLLVDPDDPAAWAQAMAGLAKDDAERDRLADAGRQRAALFSAPAAASAQIAAWRRAVEAAE
jgi:alpha-1,3-rhamnosyl/mannosyltransferase